MTFQTDPLPRPCVPGWPRWHRRGARLVSALAAATLMAACGGGADLAGVGTGGTGSFAIGSISGFGSVIVNGVRYDDSGASVYDDDGMAVSADALQLGMVVEVRGEVSDDGLTGSAASFTTVSEMKGPVTAVGVDTLTVFGQTIRVTPATVFADVGGLGGLAAGNVVEVYGLPDANGVITATRIEREAATVDAYDGDFRVRGPVSGLTGVAPDLRFTVATVAVTTDATTTVEGTIEDGANVKVRLARTAAGDGSYAATRVQVKNLAFDDEIDEAEVEGLVSDFTDAASPFKVSGYPVQLGAAVSYEGGLATDLADGVRVEVEGAVVDGTLVVRKVHFEDEEADGGDDGSDAPFEFKGVADCGPAACGGTSGSFTVTTSSGRVIEIRYDAQTAFDDGVTVGTIDGTNVEVKAVAVTGDGGESFLATRVEPND